MLTALVLLCSIGTTDCRNIAEAPDQSELPFMCLKYGQEEAAKHQVPDGKIRQGAMRAQERAPNYPVVAAWGAFLLFIGAGAFVVGMAIHNEATAKPPAPRPESIYYCAMGEEIPAFESCKEMKGQRDI